MDGNSSHEGAIAGETLTHMLDAFAACGYRVHWRLLDARKWVPQKRLRLYIVGLRNDLDGADGFCNGFSFPCDEDTPSSTGSGSRDGSGCWPTVRTILDLPDSADVANCALSSEQWARISSAAFCEKANRSARGREIRLDEPAPTLISSCMRINNAQTSAGRLRHC